MFNIATLDRNGDLGGGGGHCGGRKLGGVERGVRVCVCWGRGLRIPHLVGHLA